MMLRIVAALCLFSCVALAAPEPQIVTLANTYVDVFRTALKSAYIANKAMRGVPIKGRQIELMAKAPYNLSAEDRAAVIAKYSVGGRAIELAKLNLRPGRETDLYKVKKGDADTVQYAAGLGQLLAPGLVLALLTLIGSIVYLLIRVCPCCKCCRCCKPGNVDLPPKRALALMIAIAVCCTVVTAFAILGITESENVHQDVADDKKGMRGVALQTVQDVIDKVVNIRAPIRDVKNQVDQIAADLQTVLDQTAGTVGAGIVRFTNALAVASANISGSTTITIGGQNYNCSFCLTLANQVQSITNDANATAFTTLKPLQDILTESNDTLIKVAADIKDALQSALDGLSDAEQSARDAQYQVAYQTRDVKKYDNDRRVFTLVLLLIPCFFIVFGALGFIVRKSWPFLIIIIIGLTIMFFTWLVFAITLPLGTAIGDSCIVMNIIEPELDSELIKDGEVSKYVYACMLNKFLLGPDVLNISDDLNFTNRIQFPPEASKPVSEYLSFPAFNNKTNEVNNLGLQNTFGFPDEVIDDAIQRLNDLKGWNNITRANVRSVDVTAGIQNQTKIEAVTNLDIAEGLQPSINNIKFQFNQVNAALVNLTNDLSQAQTRLLNTRNTLQPVFDAVNDLEAQAFCGVFGDRYLDFKKLLCTGIGDSSALIALATGMVSIFTLFAVIIACKMEQVEKEHAMHMEVVNSNAGAPENSAIPLQPYNGPPPYDASTTGSAPMAAPRSVSAGRSQPTNVASGRSGPVTSPPSAPMSAGSRSVNRNAVAPAGDSEGGAF